MMTTKMTNNNPQPSEHDLQKFDALFEQKRLKELEEPCSRFDNLIHTLVSRFRNKQNKYKAIVLNVRGKAEVSDAQRIATITTLLQRSDWSDDFKLRLIQRILLGRVYDPSQWLDQDK